MRSRRLTDRLKQLAAEHRRYGIHAIPVRVVLSLPPSSIAARFRAADLLRQSREGTGRRTA